MATSNKIKVHRGRTNTVLLNLGFDTTGEVITSQIRAQPDQESTLLATWNVTTLDATEGEFSLTLANEVTVEIETNTGYMDVKRLSGGEPLPVFDEPLEVLFIGSVTV